MNLSESGSVLSHLVGFTLLLLHLSSDEAVQHRLEQVDHQLHLSFLLVARQVDHFVLVAFHQALVASGGLLLKVRGEQEKIRKRKEKKNDCGHSVFVCRQTYWERIHGFDGLSELHGGCYKDGFCS